MSPVVQMVGWTLVHALWQDALLVLLAALAGLFLRGRSRHAANGLVLFLCLLVPVATAWHFQPLVPAGPGQAILVYGGLEASSANLPQLVSVSAPLLARWEAFLQPRLPMLVIVWAVGASLMVLRLGGGYAISQRWKRRSIGAPTEWQRVVDAQAQRMGIHKTVRLLLTGWGMTPMTLGFWKPVVLFPAALLTKLPPEYLEALLAHELAHVRRLDYLSNLFQGIVETLLFFHPAIWWLSARIRAEREELADHLAAQSLGEPRRLALALNALDDLQPAFPRQLFPALAARGGPLFTRINRLLSPRPAVGPHWGLLTLLLVPCAVVALRAAAPNPFPIPVPAEIVARLDALAAKEGVDPQLLRSMAWVESGFDAKAKSSQGASGLLQVMPETARAYGAKDLNDPAQVMAAGAKYLRFLLDRYQGDLQKAVAAYNCGEKALDEGRITEEATHYRTLVMDVLKVKAVQPEAPLTPGEVQGVIRRMGGNKMVIQLRASHRGNLKVDFLPPDDSRALGSLSMGSADSIGASASGSWVESRPKLTLDAPKVGSTLVIRCEEPGLGWHGEARVTLDGAWNTFQVQMKNPRP